MAEEGVAAVDRAVALLEAFRRDEEVVSLAQLAARTDLHKTTVLRLAASLERAGLMARLPGGFRLGGRILALASIYRSSLRLERAVRPYLEALVRETGESASLYVREGRSRVCVARIETARSLRVAIVEGSTAALDETATGQILRGVRPIRGSDPYAPVFTTGLRDAETASASAPVLSTNGEIIGALTISGPASRLTEEEARRVMPTLARTARDFSAMLAGATSGARLPAAAEPGAVP